MRATIVVTAFIASALADYGISPEKCAAECTAARGKCVAKPDANMAECASEYAACLGYNPFGDHGDREEEVPTKCSKPVIAPTRPPPKPDCRHVKECEEEHGEHGEHEEHEEHEQHEEHEEHEQHEEQEEHEQHGHHHRNQTSPPPVRPTHPVVVSGGSGAKPWDFFSFLAAGIAALL
ncbi:hypothetical protein Trco_005654 [Trichoderma cornu-damae]|uniref:Uncharacterized protein n=1 Tax=Trichoderma cornu-damae TaxID=654480 RepID=A0A9P8TSS5_9HYPO|nr:hypothetical protein Trco_005654 [Trichoderma cornu-damae]